MLGTRHPFGSLAIRGERTHSFASPSHDGYAVSRTLRTCSQPLWAGNLAANIVRLVRHRNLGCTSGAVKSKRLFSAFFFRHGKGVAGPESAAANRWEDGLNRRGFHCEVRLAPL